MRNDVLVIGAGLFGAIAARALRSAGLKVSVVSRTHPLAGSTPAACLMRPTWISGLGKHVCEPSLALLNELYGVQDLDFNVGLSKTAQVHWVDPLQVLVPPDIDDVAQSIHATENGWEVKLAKREEPVAARRLVVATGVWARELVPEVPTLTGKAGSAFVWSHTEEFRPIIRHYRPFRQVVAFRITARHLWVGDGTAVIPDNFTEKHITDSLARCAAHVRKPLHEVKVLTGIRPYMRDAKPCYLAEPRPGVWVVTGGAKNGTIAAGWAAHRLREEAQAW